MEVNL